MNKIDESNHRALAIYFLKIVDDCAEKDINTPYEIGQNMLANLARDFDFQDKASAARHGQEFCADQHWIEEQPESRPKQIRTKTIRDASGNVLAEYVEPDDMIRVTLTKAGRAAMAAEWPSVNPMDGYEREQIAPQPLPSEHIPGDQSKQKRRRSAPGGISNFVVEALELVDLCHGEISISGAAKAVGCNVSTLSRNPHFKSVYESHQRKRVNDADALDSDLTIRKRKTEGRHNANYRG